MSQRSRTPQHDPGGTIHLRPHGATVISVVSAALGAALALDAVLRAGWQGVLALPLLVLVMVLVWMLLWAPRVVLHDDAVEVRNILVTHDLPFAAITDVRIGAMLRLESVTRTGRAVTVTAWNAPALGRDNPLRRQSAIREEGLRGRRSSPGERMVHDQSVSRSAVIKERWLRWVDAQEEAGDRATGPSAGSEPSIARPEAGRHVVNRVNGLAIGVLIAAIGLSLARLIL